MKMNKKVDGSSAFTLKQLQRARKLVAGQCKENLTLVSDTKRGKRVRCSNDKHLYFSGFWYTETHCFLFICSYVCLFYTVYGQSLEKDIKGDTSGNFEDLLVELSKVSVKSSYRLTNDSGSEEIFRVGVSTW